MVAMAAVMMVVMAAMMMVEAVMMVVPPAVMMVAAVHLLGETRISFGRLGRQGCGLCGVRRGGQGDGCTNEGGEQRTFHDFSLGYAPHQRAV